VLLVVALLCGQYLRHAPLDELDEREQPLGGVPTEGVRL
jgi:hypothetical protein